MALVYDVLRNGVYQRQIVVGSKDEAQRWVDAYMSGCTITLAYRF
jgi:hypothetical protein